VYKQSYEWFCNDSYVKDVKNICWSLICIEKQPDATLESFIKELLPVTDRPSAMKKLTVSTAKSHG
jgi:hypothetical protein